jgi:hypothetical protein
MQAFSSHIPPDDASSAGAVVSFASRPADPSTAAGTRVAPLLAAPVTDAAVPPPE